jgi:hypothetical protein
VSSGRSESKNEWQAICNFVDRCTMATPALNSRVQSLVVEYGVFWQFWPQFEQTKVGNSGRSCHETPEHFVRVGLLGVVLPKAGSTPRSPDRMRTMTALRQFGRTGLHHEAITSITYLQQHWHETCAPMGIGRARQAFRGSCQCFVQKSSG